MSVHVQEVNYHNWDEIRSYPPADAKSLRNNDSMEGCTYLYITDSKYCGREIARHSLCVQHAKELGQ